MRCAIDNRTSSSQQNISKSSCDVKVTLCLYAYLQEPESTVVAKC